MTREATCRKYQLLITSPKTVPITYPQSETEMHGFQMILVCDHHFELFERSNPRQNIAHDFLHRCRPFFLIDQKRIRFNLRVAIHIAVKKTALRARRLLHTNFTRQLVIR